MSVEYAEQERSYRSTTRRQFLRGGAGLMAAGAAALTLPGQAKAQSSSFSAQTDGASDDFLPFPVPQLDQNLHHNPVPDPGSLQVDASHIYHFNGQVARVVRPSGQGQTNSGKTLYFGPAGTDYSYMQGKYIPSAGGDVKYGVFSQI